MMRLIRAIAAGLLAATSLQAAERARPALGACDAPGTIFVKATGTCLRIGGSVSYEMTTRRSTNFVYDGAPHASLSETQTTSFAHARLDLEARTATSLGTLRTVVSMQSSRGAHIRRVVPSR